MRGRSARVGTRQNKDIKDMLEKAVETASKTAAETGAKIGAEKAVRATENERNKFRKQQYDSRYHNTKLLLRHYRSLNEHYKHAIYDTTKAEAENESFTEIMQMMGRKVNDEAVYIESIKKSHLRTKVIMAHVNKMLDIYRSMCEKSNDEQNKRRWRILDAMYLAEQIYSADQIAKAESIDKRTIYRDIDDCISDLTILLFGIDGIKGLN